MESLHGLIDEIQRQHSPKLRSFAVNEVNLRGYTDEHNILQAMITLKKRQGVERGLNQITGLTLAFFMGNSTLSTDSGHRLGANFDADGTLIMTCSNCETIKRLVSIMNLGDKTRFVARLKKPVFSRHGAHFLTTRPHFPGRRDWAG